MKYSITGGLGRLCQYPKTVIVNAKNLDNAISIASQEIRKLITDELGNDDPMLGKMIIIENYDIVQEKE